MPRTTVKGVGLLQDNAHPYTTAHTAETLQKLSFTILEQPSYGRDLTMSDFHLFGCPGDALKGCHFSSNHESEEAAHTSLHLIERFFLS
jgi:hypothetical protein